MFRRLIVILSILGTVAGVLALSAGAASAGTYPQPDGTSQYRYPEPRPEPVQFFGCTRAERRLESRLLFLQRIGVHLNRFQRAELRFLERLCDDDDFFFPVTVRY